MYKLSALAVATILCASCAENKEFRDVIIIDSKNDSQIFVYKKNMQGGLFLLTKNSTTDIEKIRSLYTDDCKYFAFSAKVILSDDKSDPRGKVFDEVEMIGKLSEPERRFVKEEIGYSMDPGKNISFCFLN